MSLYAYKWLIAAIILFISLGVGFAALRFARYKNFIQIGDAIANGIFIGAAIFHLLPESIINFDSSGVTHPYVYAFLLIASSFILLFTLEHQITRYAERMNLVLGTWVLMITLSIHAFIAGITLGISDTFELASIIFIAIIAHKGFEVFALTMSLHRKITNEMFIKLLLIVFSLITPIGILLGTVTEAMISTHLDYVLSACFTAFTAGAFIYIGSLHHHKQKEAIISDSHHKYIQVLALLGGILVMGLLAFWV